MTSCTCQACWALSNVAAGTAEQHQQLIEANVMTSVVRVAENGEHRCKIEACYVIANLFRSRDPKVRIMLFLETEDIAAI